MTYYVIFYILIMEFGVSFFEDTKKLATFTSEIFYRFLYSDWTDKLTNDESRQIFEIGINENPDLISLDIYGRLPFTQVNNDINQIYHNDWFKNLTLNAIKLGASAKAISQYLLHNQFESTNDKLLMLIVEKYGTSVFNFNNLQLDVYNLSDIGRYKNLEKIVKIGVIKDLYMYKFLIPITISDNVFRHCIYMSKIDMSSQEKIDIYNFCMSKYKEVLEHDGLFLEHIYLIECRTPELCEIAVRQNPLAFKYVHYSNSEFTKEKYKLFCEKMIGYISQYYLSYDVKYDVINEKKYKNETVLTREYACMLYNICHPFSIIQLNLMEIVANNDILLDVYEMINYYI